MYLTHIIIRNSRRRRRHYRGRIAKVPAESVPLILQEEMGLLCLGRFIILIFCPYVSY